MKQYRVMPANFPVEDMRKVSLNGGTATIESLIGSSYSKSFREFRRGMGAYEWVNNQNDPVMTNAFHCEGYGK